MNRSVVTVAFAALGTSCGAAYPLAMAECASVTVLQQGAGGVGCTIELKQCPDHGTARIDCDGMATCECVWHSDFASGAYTNMLVPTNFCAATTDVIKREAPGVDLCESGGA